MSAEHNARRMARVAFALAEAGRNEDAVVFVQRAIGRWRHLIQTEAFRDLCHRVLTPILYERMDK